MKQKQKYSTPLFTQAANQGDFNKFEEKKEEIVIPVVEVKDDFFPNRPLLRVSEVAQYYDVTERTVYIWIEHGHLKTERTPMGQIRITKESVNSCRFCKKKDEETS